MGDSRSRPDHGVVFGMKVQVLCLVLLCGACQAPRTAPVSSSLPAPEPAAVEQGDESTLPRWNHLDRAEHAVRAWVRDRN